MDKKFLDFQVAAPSEDQAAGRYVEGYASTFGGPPDLVGDIILPGAFAEAVKKINTEGLPLLDQHDTNSVGDLVGTVKFAREDDKGLFIRAYFVDSPDIEPIYQRVKQGAINKFSIGFYLPKGAYDTKVESGKPVRYIKQVNLVEISLVIMPANPAAVVTGVKSLPSKALRQSQSRKRKLTIIRFKNNGTI